MTPLDAAATQGAALPKPPLITVWDAPVRVFHWLMVLCFAGAWLTADSERWRLAHVSLGYTMIGLVAFRLVWGLVGTRHARFANFVRRPAAGLDDVKSLWRREPSPHVGHNPAGAWSIIALLALTLLTAAFGWANDNELGGDWLEEAHEFAANLMLIVVLLHVAGVAASSLVQRENLVRAMITGRKSGPADERIGRTWRPVAAALLAAVLGFWLWQWQTAPAAPEPSAVRHAHDLGGDDADDDD